MRVKVEVNDDTVLELEVNNVAFRYGDVYEYAISSPTLGPLKGVAHSRREGAAALAAKALVRAQEGAVLRSRGGES